MKARPSLLLASLAEPRAALELTERIAELYPETSIFLATEADSPELLKRAMRAGVREVFARPPAPEELAQALRCLVRQRQQGVGHRRTAGEIIAVFSAKGGLGATFLATLEVAYMILTEAALSFLGLGIQPPESSWGLMLSQGRQYITTAWRLVTFPGLAILLTALSLNLVATWARTVSDPAQRWRYFGRKSA